MIADQASETRSNSRACRNELSRLSIATFVAASSSCAIRSESSNSAFPRYGCSDSTIRASSALLIRSTGGAGPRRGSWGTSAGTAVPSTLVSIAGRLLRQGGHVLVRRERDHRHYRLGRVAPLIPPLLVGPLVHPLPRVFTRPSLSSLSDL